MCCNPYNSYNPYNYYNSFPIGYTWRSGKIFGVPVDLHWSFLLLPFLLVYLAWTPEAGFNSRSFLFYSLIGLLLFSFILIHELGHALTAKNRGVRAERIILFPLGGGAYLPDQPKQLWAEVLVYAAGPLANLLLAGIAFAVLTTQPDGPLALRYLVDEGNTEPIGLGQRLLALTVAINVILALGNLLPAYPLDGGRILRALLRRPLGKRRATVTVTVLGVLIGLALVVLGWLVPDYLTIVGALFIIGMSVLEYRNGWQRRRLAGKPLDGVLRTTSDLPPALYPASTVDQVRAAFARSGWPVLPVFDEWNSLRGFVEADHLEEDVTEKDEDIRRLYEPEFVAAGPEENLLEVTERIVDADVYGAAVYGERGRIIGYVFTEDVIKLLQPWWRIR